jgi:RND family efflux transporter MFP subunit
MVGVPGVLRMLKSCWMVWGALLASVPALTQAAEPLNCLIEPDRVADVGSASVGVIEEMRVERGDFVKAGQVLARLSSGVERASVAVAESRARADAEVKAAEAAASLARSKLDRAKDLVKANFISPQALEQAEAEARVADQRAQQARDARDVAQREFELSAAQLGQRLIRAPFEGIVVERYRTQGERIEREPVVKIARIHPLRVEAIAPAAMFGTIQPGQTGRVTPQLKQFGTLSATVTLVDRVVDAASNSFRVRLTLPNPQLSIPSGLRCSVELTASVTDRPASIR